jgi:hypothetical protein
MEAQRRYMELAATAAMGMDLSEQQQNQTIDHSMFDTKDLVHLTPPKVSPKVRELVKRVTHDLRNPRTGKKMGVADYIKGLIEADLKRRGLSF